ncbi:MAG TPA: hypothetical protein VGB53_14270 [Rubricoccaceae bacterium]
MSALAVSAPSPLVVLSATPLRLGGQAGTRYRLRRDAPYTGHADLDAAFSTFEAVVLEPSSRGPGSTPEQTAAAPVVTMLNGITVGLDRSLPVAVALAREGIGTVLLDTPFGGVRRPGPATGDRNPSAALAEIARRSVALDVPFAGRLFDGIALDLPAALALAAERHGLEQAARPYVEGERSGGRVALVGVSFGALLSALAFGRDGLGQRLIGAIGHPGLPAMATGFAMSLAKAAGIPPAVVAGGAALGPIAEAAARRAGGDAAVGAFRLARLFLRLGKGAPGVDPLAFAGRVSADRPVAFLAGEADPVAPPDAVRASAAAYATHTVETVPRLGHGWYPAGGGIFNTDLERFVLRQTAGMRDEG